MQRPLSRRTFIIGAGTAALLAACGGDESSDTSGSGDTELFAARYAAPFTIVADGTTQRIPLGLAEQSGPLLAADMPTEITATISRAGTAVGGAQTVAIRSEGIPFPYYPLAGTFDEADVYDIELAWDGGQVTTVIQVNAASDSPLLQPGAEIPAIVTPTFDDDRGVSPICTFAEPCDYHDVTLADALDEGRPIVLVVSTPGFCQTFVCGPMMQMCIDDNVGRPDAYRLIHAEVYDNPADLPDSTTTEIMTATGMEEAGFEPSVFFIGPDGILRERVDNVADGSELREAIDRLVAA